MIEFFQTLTAQEVFHYGGPWLSGIGSICAVVVALLLARRRRLGKPRLTVLQVTRNEVPYIRLDVVNIGEAPTTISGIGWRLGPPFGRIYLDQVPDAVAGGDALPKELSTGQWARFYVMRGGIVESWEDVLAKNFGKGPIWCWAGLCAQRHTRLITEPFAKPYRRSFVGCLPILPSSEGNKFETLILPRQTQARAALHLTMAGIDQHRVVDAAC